MSNILQIRNQRLCQLRVCRHTILQHFVEAVRQDLFHRSTTHPVLEASESETDQVTVQSMSLLNILTAVDEV